MDACGLREEGEQSILQEVLSVLLWNSEIRKRRIDPPLQSGEQILERAVRVGGALLGHGSPQGHYQRHWGESRENESAAHSAARD